MPPSVEAMPKNTKSYSSFSSAFASTSEVAKASEPAVDAAQTNADAVIDAVDEVVPQFYDTAEDAIEDYLAKVGVKHPDQAVVAVAGPIAAS